MTRNCLFHFLLTAALAMAGCTPIRVQVRADPEADFGQYATFAWIEQPDGYNPAKDLVPGFRRQVRSAVETILIEKGYDQAPEGATPDFRVAFYTHVTHKHRVLWVSNWGYPYHPWSAYWGYNWGPWYDPWSPPWVDVDYYDVGTMVIDVIDAESNELVWRGWGRGVSSPGTPAGQLMAAARKIMKRFPARG